MISCRDAKHLFGRYLDGELTATLQTELHAHRLNCTACQNELALLEACGDVIALDRREPTVSASFTDRVLLARRAQVKPLRRNWARTLLMYGAPMAAAASIALMLTVIQPVAQNRTAIAGAKVAVPTQVLQALEGIQRPMTEREKQELAATPAMPVDGFVDALLAPGVDKCKSTADNARRGAEDFLETLREVLASKNEQLVAGWKSARPESAEPVGPPAPNGDSLWPDSTRTEQAGFETPVWR